MNNDGSPPGSPYQDDDDIPCKGCGQVLEEGKAFELAGNRWHIDCFRCNSCSTLLDSDANLLLLGDGSLICSSCTYSCTACNQKIEDLAILTGDQAYCAGCFRCRNCKRKIENLKYARTSQGIFCMGCHETLMSRRKKSSRPKPSSRTPTSETQTPMMEQKKNNDKSLPPLPPPDSGDGESPTPAPSRPSPSAAGPSLAKFTPQQLSPMGLSADNLRTSRAQKRHSFQGLDQLTANGNPFGDFTGNIPLVLDDSSHGRSSQYSGSEWERIKPSDGKITSAYEAENRNARPHIATQDRSYELQAALDKSEIPRISHESAERVERLLNSAGRATSDVGSSEGFRLGETPRERKRSIGGMSPPETAAPSPPRDSMGSIPPRGDSIRPSLSRMNTPFTGMSSSTPPLNRPQYSYSPLGSSSVSVKIDSPESASGRRPSVAQESNFSPISDSDSEPSNALGHGRSLSELAVRSPGEQAYGDMVSPMYMDPKDEIRTLKQELRRSTQRIVELETKLNNSASAKALQESIMQKRSTVALLETEREAFLRELMVIKQHLDASKTDGKSINPVELKSGLISGLTKELEALKATLKADISDLVQQRDQLLEDVESFGRLREQAIMETEQLNMKNAQLADLNNELTGRIQAQFKANSKGLGIYDGDTELMDPAELEKRLAQSSASLPTIGLPYDATVESSEVMIAQKVSPFKNGVGQKKQFWKKPGAAIMKNAGKLSNKVFATEIHLDGAGIILDPRFPGGKPWVKKDKKNGAAPGEPVITAPIDPNAVLMFGGDLVTRTEYEGTKIPAVVQKCIQEVEMRGMDMEGIYRKSGGATQMRQIQDEFERGEDVQFSPDLDICSVTSVLKQYFRNLPNPLITYELYDRFVESTNEYEVEKRVELLRQVTEDLPQAHRDVLQFVIFHLARVAARREENLMNSRNLAVVFAPTLLRHMSDEREMSDMHMKNNAIQFLIDNNESIFQL
ncbi:hypothetical protein BZA77DRAFT_250415 [Pyronema omphalodes]|nr:hypothetical protein BZA77DRAFT_250415 [Pyronema omphalodes]